MDDHLIILQFQGPFTGPLEPSQNKCLAEAARSFRWARPPRAPP